MRVLHHIGFKDEVIKAWTQYVYPFWIFLLMRLSTKECKRPWVHPIFKTYYLLLELWEKYFFLLVFNAEYLKAENNWSNIREPERNPRQCGKYYFFLMQIKLVCVIRVNLQIGRLHNLGQVRLREIASEICFFHLE